MKGNFFESAFADRIGLVFITIIGCFLVYCFFLKKNQRECGSMIVTTETFYNPGTAPGSQQPKEKLALLQEEKPGKLKQKTKESINDVLLTDSVILHAPDGQTLLVLNQLNGAKIQLLEEHDWLQEEIPELRDKDGKQDHERGERDRMQDERDKVREDARESSEGRE